MIQLTDYSTLGRSGLKVSPICLGTMTFGNYRWGSQDDEARQIFGAYLDAGGNFIDTADGYAVGKSEELIGSYMRELELRDRIVLATKFTFNTREGIQTQAAMAARISTGLSKVRFAGLERTTSIYIGYTRGTC